MPGAVAETSLQATSECQPRVSGVEERGPRVCGGPEEGHLTQSGEGVGAQRRLSVRADG